MFLSRVRLLVTTTNLQLNNNNNSVTIPNTNHRAAAREASQSETVNIIE